MLTKEQVEALKVGDKVEVDLSRVSDRFEASKAAFGAVIDRTELRIRVNIFGIGYVRFWMNEDGGIPALTLRSPSPAPIEGFAPL